MTSFFRLYLIIFVLVDKYFQIFTLFCLNIFFPRCLFVIPNQYAIGTMCEDLRHASLAANSHGRILVVVQLTNLGGFLKFNTANSSIFKLSHCSHANISHLSFTIIRMIAHLVFNLIFVPFRLHFNLVCSFLVRKDYSISYYLNLLSFPYLSMEAARTLLASTLHTKSISHNLDSAKISWSINSSEFNEASLFLKTHFPSFSHQTKYCCLHVRSPIYHNDDSRRPYRNAQLSNYKRLLSDADSLGINIVLFGDYDDSDLSHELSLYGNVFDLRKYPQRPASVDLSLIKSCYFYIGMQSGPLDLALLFRKDILILNAYNLSHLFSYQSRIIVYLRNFSSSAYSGYKALTQLPLVQQSICETDLTRYCISTEMTETQISSAFIRSISVFTSWPSFRYIQSSSIHSTWVSLHDRYIAPINASEIHSAPITCGSSLIDRRLRFLINQTIDNRDVLFEH